MRVEVSGEEVVLGPEKYLYWPKASLIAIADLHLGRATALQSQGIPLPEGSDDEDLARVANIIHIHRAQTIVMLGDIFHSRLALKMATVEKLRATLAAVPEVVAIVGNHDLGVVKKFREVSEAFNFCETYTDGPFGFCHEYVPNLDPSLFWWSGHIHPRVTVGLGPDSMRLPAFLLTKRNGILPAFSSLAAGVEVPKRAGAARYACIGDQVMRVD